MNNQNNNTLPHIVIIGGGFGGLAAARALKRAPVRVTLVDRTNHHLFQPLLYQVAMAGLSPADIAEPIRTILRQQKNVTVLLAEAVGVNFEQGVVQLADGTCARLVIALYERGLPTRRRLTTCPTDPHYRSMRPGGAGGFACR